MQASGNGDQDDGNNSMPKPLSGPSIRLAARQVA